MDHLPKEVQEMVACAAAWSDATCSFPTGSAAEEWCNGENHLMECAVERARQDLLTCIEKVRRLP